MTGPVLILGGGGRLGRLLHPVWPDPNVVWHSRRPLAGHVSFDILDDAHALEMAVRGSRAVLCLAGVTNTSAVADMQNNVRLAAAAVRSAHAVGCPRVLLASSAAVYGRSDEALSEDGLCVPLSEYGRAKLEMEHETAKLGSDLGVQVCALRIGNIAGADAILGGWKEGFVLDVFDDGASPRRSYIGPVTLARVLDTLSRAARLPDVLNIAAPGSVTMGDLLDAAGLPWAPRPARNDAIQSVVLDTSRLKRYVQFQPEDSTPPQMCAEIRATQGTVQK